MKKHNNKLIFEIFLVWLIIVLLTLIHGYNMFHFPYYENDEGTYMSQAWAIIHSGKLAPYNYTYDHLPGGWILLAIWTLISGGFFTFGTAVNSGRVLILILHIASCLVLYLTTKKLTRNIWISVLAVAFFTFSPLGIYFQRRVLLDNIMVFWTLSSLLILVGEKLSQRKILFSGLLFAVSVFTKEISIFFLPAFIYILYVRQEKNKFPLIITWCVAFIIPVILFLLYVSGKGELFPYGSIFGGNRQHISLIGTWIDQFKRPGGSLFDRDSLINQSIYFWFKSDPVIFCLSLAALAINLIFGIRNRLNLLVLILALPFTLFLLKGGVIYDFYFLPLLPFNALNIAVAFGVLVQIAEGILSENLISKGIIITTVIIFANLFIFGNRIKNYSLFTSDQTAPQIKALNWILSHNNPQAFYAIDNYGYTDLHENQNANFRYAEYYWKIEKEPDVYVNILKNKWQNIDYILLTPQMKTDITFANLSIVKSALDNSREVVKYSQDGMDVSINEVSNK